MYYRGLIFFKEQNWQEARRWLRQARQAWKRHPERYSFVADLHLYFAASLLCDHANAITGQELQLIADSLRQIEGSLGQSILYKETTARYRLAILKKSGKFDANAAKEILALIADCVRSFPENGDYYFIKGEVYKYLRDYRHAMESFTRVLELQPNRVEAYLEKLNLLGNFLPQGGFKNYYQELLQYLESALRVKIEPFSREFNKLRRQYVHLRYSLSKGIPYSEAMLARFYPNLFSPAHEIRKVAEKVIAAMTPRQQLLQALEKKLDQASAAHKRILLPLQKRLIYLQDKQIHNQVLFELSKLPPYGDIRQQLLPFFQEQTPLLQQILEDRHGKLGSGSSDSWLLMRFLAARVLVRTRQASLRNWLYDQCLLDRQGHISTRIVVAYALYEIGLTWFPRKFLWDYLEGGTDEFLRYLALECIEPIDSKNTAILLKIFDREQGFLRAKAISRLLLGIGKTVPVARYRQLIAAVFAARADSNPQIRALALLQLSQPQMEQMFSKFTSPQHQLQETFIAAVNDPSPLVQRTAYSRMQFFSCLNVDLSSAIPIVRQRLHARSSSWARYHCIMALGEMGDRQMVQDILFSTSENLLSKVATLLGILRFRAIAIGNQSYMRWIINSIMQLASSYPDNHFRAMLIYTLCRYFHLIKEHVMANGLMGKVFENFLRRKLLEGLQSKNPCLRLYSIGAVIFLPIDQELVKHLQMIYRQAPQLHIRATALEILTYLGYRYQSCDVEKMQRWLEKQSPQSNQKIRSYYSAMAYGYYYTIFEEIACPVYVAERMRWDDEFIRSYHMKMFEFRVHSHEKRAFYRIGLARIVRLLKRLPQLSLNERKLLSEAVEMMIRLYLCQQKWEKARQWIGSCEKEQLLSLSESRFWQAKILWHQGKKGQASLFLNSPPGSFQQQARTIRLLSQLCLDNHHYSQAEKLLLQQYLLCPSSPQALLARGKYYFSRKNNIAASYFFNRSSQFFCGEAYFYLARLAAARQDLPDTAKCLALAYDNRFIFSLKMLRSYPELRNFPPGKFCFEIAAAMPGFAIQSIVNWLVMARQHNFPVTRQMLFQDARFSKVCYHPRFARLWNKALRRQK